VRGRGRERERGERNTYIIPVYDILVSDKRFVMTVITVNLTKSTKKNG